MSIKKINIVQSGYRSETAHYYVQSDGVLRIGRAFNAEKDSALWVNLVAFDEREITDAQCQAIVSIGLASCLNYGLDRDKDIHVIADITWDEIVRRG